MPESLPFPALLAAAAAAGEATRLRLLALLAEAELTVSELVAILGQSQPRISRHLKLLAEARLVERHREGAWVFFRLAQTGAAAGVARDLIARLAAKEPPLSADRARLAEVRHARAEQAARYFATHAANWDELRHACSGRARRGGRPQRRRRFTHSCSARPWNWNRPDARALGAGRSEGRRHRFLAADVEPCPRAHREGGAAPCPIAARRYLCRSRRAKFLRSRHHPSVPALSRRSFARDPRGRPRRATRRAAPHRRFCAS